MLKLKYYSNWIDVANEFWRLGMTDKHPLQRHRTVFDLISDHAQTKPSEVDYDNTALSITFRSEAFPDRHVTFSLGRFHGRAEIEASITGEPVKTRVTPNEVAEAFRWLNEKIAKRQRAKKVKTAEAASGR